MRVEASPPTTARRRRSPGLWCHEPATHGGAARVGGGAVRAEPVRTEDNRAYTEGSYGYLGRTGTVTTRQPIAGTDDRALYSSAAKGAYEYRFDGLPDGTYQVELGFAELSNTQPGKRVFDVLAEGVQELPDVDIALEAGGTYRALARTFTVHVVDGQLNLRFASPSDQPLVNSIRVTHRPDLG
ncbi:malectin domain-containing carbohydrate-binding protein [Streptomyces sp. OR43]|uniref:malectin domain-containing carbohydrate-binding protein n=1 Tax=Streptomyces sp. or43 TaxID=2478957 RepID=UPI0011CD9A8F|nr:malectin domain-containing carbohydrate-binding protein [Streptomyces sp. or43]TXS44665.1 hypothetical protein EAO72_08035 [Streptomyces sp. or43]